MLRILIVEDEKLIRQGIKTMVMRTPVEVAEILEARNGEEALVILMDRKIDLLITDIRMPKMNGIELIKKIQTLSHKPEIIVISGYDDFNYAIESLRLGVRDYLLKPIERDKLNDILVQINNELIDGKKRGAEIKRIDSQQLKYIILNHSIGEEEISAMEKSFDSHFINKNYMICVCNYKKEADSKAISHLDINVLILHNVSGQTAFIVEEKDLALLLQRELKQYCVGVSGIHQGIREIREGYLEACKARKEAFVKITPFFYYQENNLKFETIPESFPDQFIQLFGSGQIDRCLSKLNNMQFKARNNLIEADKLLMITDHILDKLIETYERMIEFNMDEFIKLKDPMRYRDASEYYSLFSKWMQDMQQIIQKEFTDYKNKEKINEAIIYINNNFANDLNMAVVSNHISMNYSLFSLNFKEYTGVNFVNYLKNIRIDEAKKLLGETEDKIIEISQAVGYENEKHFMKVFKNVCGVSPSEYRKNMNISRR